MNLTILEKTLSHVTSQNHKKTTSIFVSLLLLTMLTPLLTLETQAATTGTFTLGNTSVGTLTNQFATDRDASRFQLTQSGVIQSITVYFTKTGFNAKAAIYTDNNGSPGTLLAQSNSQAITTSGWNTFAVPQKSLTSGYFWLCVVSSSYSATGAMTSASTYSHVWKTSTYSSEYPSTFGTPSGSEKTVTSIYATLSSSATPTPTPAPSPTATPTPTPKVTPTATPTPTPTPTSVPMNPYGGVSPTATPTPTPTPTATPTPVASSSRINAIWLHSDDIASINYNTLQAAKITDIYMLTADWTNTYTLNKLLNDQEIANMLTNAHNKGIRVHAWTIRFWGNGQAALDITTANARSACVNAATALVTKSYGGQTFDGHNDDLVEYFKGSWQNYADYLSALTTSLHKNGKISSVDMLVWTGYPVETRFPTLNCDYICGMFYSDQTWSQSDFKATIPRALKYSTVPLVIGMYYDTRIGPYSAGSQLQYVGNTLSTISDKTKLAGFSLYSGDQGGWRYIDWTSWNNWKPAI